MDPLNFDDLKYIQGDEDLIKVLLESWSLPGLYVVGKLQRHKNAGHEEWRLMDVRNLAWQPLEYPIIGLRSAEKIASAGVLVRDYTGADTSGYVHIPFELSPKQERKGSRNRLQITALGSAVGVHRLTTISEASTIKGEKGEVLIDETVLELFRKENAERLDELTQNIETEVDAKTHELGLLENQLNAKTAEMNLVLDALKAQKTELSETATENERLKSTIEGLEGTRDEVTLMIELLQTEEESVINRARGKFRRLRSWGLIGDDVIPEFREEAAASASEVTSFDGDFNSLISRVQSYLYRERSLVYPKHLLLDFLTLLRMNDFIVLAGQPGSGKTQLVKSFAMAIGAHAEVVAVKPNWTSSEDLLGYWNGVQNQYHSTQFLEMLRKAATDPNKLYLICLDEMNLAHVEYYLADFLSALEERKEARVVTLSAGVDRRRLFRLAAGLMNRYEAKEDSLESLLAEGLKDGSFVQELRRIIPDFDLREGKLSEDEIEGLGQRLLHEFHGRMAVPDNVRIIGAINIDETTQTLSPKVLDRAHVVRIESPLTYFEQYRAEAVGEESDGTLECKPLLYSDLRSKRDDYPEFDATCDLTKQLSEWSNTFFRHFRASASMRTLRQAQLYRDLMLELGVNEQIILNNVVRHKFLPRFSLDFSRSINASTGTAKVEKVEALVTKCLKQFRERIGAELNYGTERVISCVDDLDRMNADAKNNGGVATYWG